MSDVRMFVGLRYAGFYRHGAETRGKNGKLYRCRHDIGGADLIGTFWVASE